MINTSHDSTSKTILIGNVETPVVRRSQAGKKNTIELPVVEYSSIAHLIGGRVKQGDCGAIYEVSNSNSGRLFKAIPLSNFKNGDEIRISEMADNMGVSPKVHGAFLMQHNNEIKHVIIEMDHAGKTLGGWMEDLAPPPPPPKPVTPIELSPEEKARMEMIEKIQAKYRASSNFEIVEIPQKPKLNMSDALDKMYPKQEIFYFELFNKLKILAEHKIAYRDTHVGNIIPKYGAKNELQLIDFDRAKLTTNVETAKAKTIRSLYVRALMEKFSCLPDLSNESRELISWFE